MSLSRREMLLATGAALLGPAAATRLFASEKRATKKVLFFTKSSGFEHSVIKRPSSGDLSMAERILTEIGKSHNFEVVCSKDGRLFDPDKIGEWDAFVFVTTGVLTEAGTDKTPPMSKEGKQAFLDAIHGGKGFVGMHCASDTFHSKPGEIDPYIQMIGGEFIIHGDQQKVKLDITDPSFPGVKDFGKDSFEILDEWYALKNQARRPPRDPGPRHVHVQDEDRRQQVLRSPQFPGDLGPHARQGARLLHVDGAPRRRLGEQSVPRIALGGLGLGDQTGRGLHRAQRHQGHARLPQAVERLIQRAAVPERAETRETTANPGAMRTSRLGPIRDRSGFPSRSAGGGRRFRDRASRRTLVRT